MNYFDKSRNFTEKKIINGELISISSTGKINPVTPEDTRVRSEKNIMDNDSVWDPVLVNAGKDPVNPYIEGPCEKCGAKLVKFIRIGDERKLKKICEYC